MYVVDLFWRVTSNETTVLARGSDIVEIDAETVDDIIELIKNQIDTIKNENTDGAKFLTDIETYFNSTIKLIQQKKKKKNHKPIYDALMNNS